MVSHCSPSESIAKGATLYKLIIKFSPSKRGNVHSCTSSPTLKLSDFVTVQSVPAVSLKT